MPVAKLVVNEAMAVNIKLTICRLLLLFGSLWQLPPERLSTVFYLYRRHCVIDLLFSIGGILSTYGSAAICRPYLSGKVMYSLILYKSVIYACINLLLLTRSRRSLLNYYTP